MTQLPSTLQRSRTKIVATLGPESNSYDTIRDLVLAGLSVARLNLSHNTLDEHDRVFRLVRQVSDDLGIPVGIMVDIPGPKYRTGPQSPGEFYMEPGDKLVLTSRDVVGNPDVLGVYPSGVHTDATIDGSILLDDGAIELRVLDIEPESMDVSCEVVRGNRMVEGKGVTTPGRAPSLPFLDDRARDGLKFAAKFGADFVALSNVTRPEDIDQARDLIADCGRDTFIISKIETEEAAVTNFDDILEVSDGIMVARGDLGVAMDAEWVPIMQEEMIEKCNLAGKPVITATQMLESMIKSASPTRAEVNDVSNAVRQGTDAVMLSGETAVGDNPVLAVETMNKVALAREAALDYERMLEERSRDIQPRIDDGISYGAARNAVRLGACGIIAFTESGSTARRVSRYRPGTPILALTPHEKVLRMLTVSWGVSPVKGPDLTTVSHLLNVSEGHAVSSDLVPDDGGKVVITAGFPFGTVGSTNFLYIMDIPPKAARQEGSQPC
jgi:pyruvate kinase